MRTLLLFCVSVTIAFGQETGGNARLDEILERFISRDVFTAALARKELHEWADGVGKEAVGRPENMRKDAKGRLADALDAAIEELGGTPPEPDPERAEAEIGDILDRLGLDDRDVLRVAMEDFDAWVTRAGKDARDRVRALKPEQPGIRADGVQRALDRIDGIDRALLLELQAKTEDEIRLLAVMKGFVEADNLRPMQSQLDLEAWAARDPAGLRELLQGWALHPDARINRPVRGILATIEELLSPTGKLLRQLEALGVPRLDGARRVLVRGRNLSALPLVPCGEQDEGARGWLISVWTGKAVVLFDDGCTRVGDWDREGVRFGDDIEAVQNGSDGADENPEWAFWRALLVARWSLERSNPEDAVDCLAAARDLALEAWPDDNEERLAARVLEIGAAFLLRYAEEPLDDEQLDLARWTRMASVPIDAVRRRGEEGVLRWKRKDQERGRWSGVTPEEVSGFSVKGQADYWLWRLLNDERTRTWTSGDLMDALDAPEPGSAFPEVRLADLGCGAIPNLVDRLGDGAGSSVRFGARGGTISSICRLILWRLMGDAAKPDVDPATGDLLPLANPQELQRVLLSRWEELSKLDELPRQRILFEAHSPRAENWLLARDPASVMPALMKALPEDERRREMALRKLEGQLRYARVDVLQKLREESSGEQKELVQRAIDASNALR